VRGLTGSGAVARLERRGGQVWVFRKGYGSQAEFDCIAREDGHAVVVGNSKPGAPERYGPHRFVLQSEADRARLAHEMDRVLDVANTGLERVEYRYELVHRDILDGDAGYAQVGCFVAVLSIVVGLVIGGVGGWIATGGVNGSALVIGSIVGFVVGFLGIEPVSSIAVNYPTLRDRITDLAIGWHIVVPGVVAAVAVIVATIAMRPG
jgi:hypothetical protein